MVKSPLVFVAGHLRTAGAGVSMRASRACSEMGQTRSSRRASRGGTGADWLTSDSVGARWNFANSVLDADDGVLAVPQGAGDHTLAAEQQVDRALAALGRPWISRATRQALVEMADGFYADLVKSWQIKTRPPRADMLQRTLRHLILTGPDAHLH